MLVRSLQTLFVLTLAALVFYSVSYESAIAEQCITIGQKKVCFDDGKGNKNDDDDNKGGGNKGGGKKGGGQKPKPTGNKCQGEIACPPGYVVLDKPNQYGACCEQKGGVPAKEAKCILCETCTEHCHGVWQKNAACEKHVAWFKAKGAQAYCNCKEMKCSCEGKDC